MDEVARGTGRHRPEVRRFFADLRHQRGLFRYGIHPSGCMTLDILGRANGIEFKDLKHKGSRQGCHCIESRDIGAYDTCLKRLQVLLRQQKTLCSPFRTTSCTTPPRRCCLGHLRPDDTIAQGAQKSFRQGGAAWLSVPLGAMALYEALLRAYGEPRWWSEDAYTVLFQACWYRTRPGGNVEKTCAAIGGRIKPEVIGELSPEELEALIRPCGFCRGKARAIRALTAWFGKYGFERQNAAGVSTERIARRTARHPRRGRGDGGRHPRLRLFPPELYRGRLHAAAAEAPRA